MQTIATACHVAAVHPMTGLGLLVLPLLEHDVFPPSGPSLHAADGMAALARLRQVGFEPVPGDDGDPWTHVGYMADGRELVSLYGLNPIVSKPTVVELAEAHAELLALLAA
jgi:hypothetical protein